MDVHWVERVEVNSAQPIAMPKIDFRSHGLDLMDLEGVCNF